MSSSSLTHSHLVYGTCPDDGYMPPWDYISRQAFYSSTYYPYIPLLSVYYLDRTVTDTSYPGPFSVAVSDGGATKKFEDLTWVSQMNFTTPTTPPDFWNATHTANPQSLLLSQQEFMMSLGVQNGTTDGKPILISF